MYCPQIVGWRTTHSNVWLLTKIMTDSKYAVIQGKGNALLKNQNHSAQLTKLQIDKNKANISV